MIRHLDLGPCLVPSDVVDVEARGRAGVSRRSDDVTARVFFDNGSQAPLPARRISPIRRRGMRAVYPDGVIEIDFITRQVRNTTRRPLSQLQLDDPLGESIASFIEAARLGAASLVRPEEARRALETALLIEEAAAPELDAASEPVALSA